MEYRPLAGNQFRMPVKPFAAAGSPTHGRTALPYLFSGVWRVSGVLLQQEVSPRPGWKDGRTVRRQAVRVPCLQSPLFNCRFRAPTAFHPSAQPIGLGTRGENQCGLKGRDYLEAFPALDPTRREIGERVSRPFRPRVNSRTFPSPLDWAEESPPVGPEASAHAGRWLSPLSRITQPDADSRLAAHERR